MTKVVVHQERFSETVAGATPPAADDVTILAGGRRLDTPDKVRAFVAEFDAEQARRLSRGNVHAGGRSGTAER